MSVRCRFCGKDVLERENLQERMDLKGRLICTIFRNNKSIIPSGHDTLQKGDHVIVVTANHQTLDIKDIVEG